MTTSVFRIALCAIVNLPTLSCTTGSGPESGFRGARIYRENASGNSFETFEAGNKQAYASAQTNLQSGLWQLNGALIGKDEKDLKRGKASLRLKEHGSATMLFNVQNQIEGIEFVSGTYNEGESSAISAWYSTDNGGHWLQMENPVEVSGHELQPISFTANFSGSVRFRIENDGKDRINIDDINIVSQEGRVVSATNTTVHKHTEVNMAIGNPSAAKTDVNNPDNYLLQHPQYSLSYNDKKGIPNWVSWHLSSSWTGVNHRCNCFSTDNTLPPNFYHSSSSDYSGSGFREDTYAHLKIGPDLRKTMQPPS